MLTRNTGFALLAALLLLPISALATDKVPPPGLNKAQLLVFFKDHLKGVGKDSLLDYDFKSETKDAESFTDHIEVKVTNVVDESKRDMEFNFLTGSHHINFSPAKGYTGNPVLIHFLERDISLMTKDAGGFSGFYRNRIRDSFKQPSEIKAVKFQLNGKDLEGTEIIVTPFVGDPFAKNFKLYENKRYEFIFSDQVPGGIYRIHTQVPDATNGSVLIDESMTFREIMNQSAKQYAGD
ncbi:MAG: hypothetical protein P8045_04660 [Candidatus Thiodiazotropha sp.]